MTAPKKRLRIAVLNRNFTPTAGGAERYSIALVEELAQDHEIHVFAQRIEHQWPGVHYHRVATPLSRPRWINQLWYASATWWATRRGFDIVHSHENTWHGQVQTVHVLPVRCKLFLDRSGWRLVQAWLKVLSSPRLLTYLALERARFSGVARRCVVLPSDSLRQPMISAYPSTQGALRLVTPGITAVAGRATAQQQRAARQALGLPLDGRSILFVGNDYRKKGLSSLLKALAQLPRENWLAVVGDSAQKPEFLDLARRAGVAERVFFLGPLRVITDAYVAADCLAHPTLEDTFAMVVLEAMAHGLPVLVSNQRYCGISSLLRDETNALILQQPADAQALAKGLRRILDDAQLQQSLSVAGLDFARGHLWSASARQQELIYFSLLDGAPASCSPIR